MTTPSVDALVEHLQQAEIKIFWGPVERHDSTSLYIYDPDGVHVELRVDLTDTVAL